MAFNNKPQYNQGQSLSRAWFADFRAARESMADGICWTHPLPDRYSRGRPSFLICDSAMTVPTPAWPPSRRDFLWRAGGGCGGLALSWLLARDAAAAGKPLPNPLAARKP